MQINYLNIGRSLETLMVPPFRTPVAADEPLMEPRAVTEAEQLVAAENVPDRKIGVQVVESVSTKLNRSRSTRWTSS